MLLLRSLAETDVGVLSWLAAPCFPPTCRLCLAEVSPSAVTYSNKSRVLPVRASLALRPGEAVLQVAWQTLVPADASFHTGSEGAGTAVAAAAAVLTSQRLLIVNERLGVVASASVPADMGLPVSCLWMGPALLLSTTTGQVSVGAGWLRWNGLCKQTQISQHHEQVGVKIGNLINFTTVVSWLYVCRCCKCAGTASWCTCAACCSRRRRRRCWARWLIAC